MPQYRRLYAKIVQSFDFNEMPDDFTRCLWMLLPLGLDCEGRGILNSSWIKSKLMPLRDDVDGLKIMQAMEWFEQRGMIIFYVVNSREYFYIPTFKVYQAGTEKEMRSLLPAPELLQSSSRVTPELLQSYSRAAPEQVLLAASASASESESVNASASEFKSGEIYKIYEREIGLLTPMIKDALQDAENEYPPGWIEAALHEAATNNKRSWKYAEAILKRWKVDGFQSRSNSGGKTQPVEDDRKRIARMVEKAQEDLHGVRRGN